MYMYIINIKYVILKNDDYEFEWLYMIICFLQVEQRR